jgi:hypothetical protein
MCVCGETQIFPCECCGKEMPFELLNKTEEGLLCNECVKNVEAYDEL